MKTITGLTDQPKQTSVLTLVDGSSVVWTLEYKPQQLGWFYSVAWQGVTISGQRLVASPNLLRQFLNTLPFGIAIITTNSVDPLGAEDFIDGTIAAYLLEGADLTDIETAVFGAPAVQTQPVAQATGGSPVIIPPAAWGPAGGDLRGSYPNPDVAAIHEAGGQQLTIGPIGDGQFTKRVGSSLVGVAAPSGGSSIGVRRRSDLRAYVPLGDKQFIVEEGYGFEGDGGGGLWFFVAADNYSTDNDGTLVVPGGVLGTPATDGCWHRVMPGTKGNSIVPATTLDVRWFGAIPDQSTDVAPKVANAYAALFFASAQQVGTLYFPAGYYKFATKLVLDGMGYSCLSIKGDGPRATVLNYGMSGSDTCMIEAKNFSSFAFQNLSVEWRDFGPTINNPAVLWFHDIAICYLSRLYASSLTGTCFKLETISQLSSSQVVTLNSDGCQCFINGCGGTLNNFSFGTAGESAPALWVAACNSLQCSDGFTAGGGPSRSFAAAAVASTPTDFTVTLPTGHAFSAGDYVRIRNATHAGYNHRWKVDSVTTTSVTILSTANLGSDSVTLSTLWSSILLGGFAGGNVTESSFDNILANTGGDSTEGAVGMFLDGRASNGIGGIKICEVTCDYGNTAFFAHGVTTHAFAFSTDIYASNVGSLLFSECQPNGGPRDDFGSFRLEGVSGVTLTNCCAFPGNNNPPGTGMTFNSLVISDGGQTYFTQDITINGGNWTTPNSSELYPSATIYAFTFDGGNVRRVHLFGVGVDTVSSNANVVQFLNSAAAANDITAMYGTGGRVALLDSTGTHNL